MKEQDKNKIKTFIIVAIIAGGAAQMGWLSAFGIEPFTFGTIDLDLVGADDVYFKIQVKESLGAFASEDIIVNVYDMDMVYLGSATASSGLATFAGFSVKEGQHVFVQGRQAAPATADGYVTPLTEFIVGQGDAADTVSAKDAITGESILWVDNLHDSTEPTFAVYAPDGQDLTAGTADNLTTADLYFSLTIRIAEDECWFGAPDFTDGVTGEDYIGGIWIVWRGSNSYDFEQGSARHHLSWDTTTYSYHAWNFDVRLWQDSLRTGDVNVYTMIMTLANGADFDQGAETLSIDVYDMMLNTGLGNPQIGNFIDGGALAPVGYVAYVD